MSFKQWLNVVTLVLVLLVLFFARNDIIHAWHLLGQVNIWIFLLIIPIQFVSYYANGEMIFAYLRKRGDLQNVPPLEAPKMALEFNFVNHIFPTGGMSGISYMTWRLAKLGVRSGRATLAQVVKFAATFISFAVLAVVSVLVITADVGLNRFAILAASGLVMAVVLIILGTIYLLSSRGRLEKFEHFVDVILNKKITRLIRREKPIVARTALGSFFEDMHNDYRTLREQPKLLIQPLLWGLIFNISETMMFFVTFMALGTVIDPAAILIATGLAGLAGAFFVTPGGAGGYEAVMVLFLTLVGVTAGIALAGVVLARTVLILVTIATGYIVYHQAVKKYGKAPTASQ